MEHQDTEISCPFCHFSDVHGDSLIQHVEIYHSEDGHFPFTATQNPVAPSVRVEDQHLPNPASVDDGNSNDSYIDCPQDCGESVLVAELPTHLDLHIAERIALAEVGNVVDADDPNGTIKSDDDCEAVYDHFSMTSLSALRKRGNVLQTKDPVSGRKRDARARESGISKGPSAERQRAKKAKRGSSNVASSSSVCQLGVRKPTFTVHFYRSVRLTWRSSEWNWDPMLMRSRCHPTSGRCWRRVQK